MNKLFIFFYIIVFSFSNIWAMDNPFLKKYNTEFEIPPFSKIDESDFMPAFKMGIEAHNREIDSIIKNSEDPSFENVIIELERSGSLLDRVGAVFFNLSGSIKKLNIGINKPILIISKSIDIKIKAKSTKNVFLSDFERR